MSLAVRRANHDLGTGRAAQGIGACDPAIPVESAVDRLEHAAQHDVGCHFDLTDHERGRTVVLGTRLVLGRVATMGRGLGLGLG